MTTKSPSRPQSNVRRQIKVAATGESVDARVLTHLPATVTTRRSQSPHRRPPSAQDQRQSQTAITLENNESRGTPQQPDSRFFRASEAQQAARTPTTTAKPPFFTAKSYSTTSKSATVTPDLRRAESAIDVRPRSNSRLVATRTPTLRDLSPSRKANATPRAPMPHLSQQQMEELNSPSPFPGSSDRPPLNRDTASSIKPAPRLPRQTSMASLRSSTGTETDLGTRKTLENASSATTTETVSTGRDHGVLASNSLHPARNEVQTGTANSATRPVLRSPKSESNIMAAIEEATSLPTQIHRKVMDLEIRNTSLMAVNNLLEKQSRKHASEMKELRKRIVFMTKFPQTNTVGQDLLPVGDGEHDEEADEIEERDDLQEVGDRLLLAANNVDHAIRRALLLSEQLLTDANRGLHYRPRESEIGLGMRRVLLSTVEDDSELMSEDGQVPTSADQTMSDFGGTILPDAVEQESDMIL